MSKVLRFLGAAHYDHHFIALHQSIKICGDSVNNAIAARVVILFGGPDPSRTGVCILAGNVPYLLATGPSKRGSIANAALPLRQSRKTETFFWTGGPRIVYDKNTNGVCFINVLRLVENRLALETVVPTMDDCNRTGIEACLPVRFRSVVRIP